MLETWLPIISFALWVLVPFGMFVGRHWIIARISKGVQHHFDRKIEELRAELRKGEEQLKSELRDKEAEIAALRNTVLAGSAGRQAVLPPTIFLQEQVSDPGALLRGNHLLRADTSCRSLPH